MFDFVTAHFHNAAKGSDEALANDFVGDHLTAVRRLRGWTRVQRFELTPEQLMPDIAQPWRYLSLYEFRLSAPEIDIPALGPLLANFRDGGLVADDGAERIHSYRMYSPWKYSDNYKPGPLTHLMLLLANVVPGREAEYHKWYDEHHSYEVSESPGYVGMKRGQLAEVQISPVQFCPGGQLILGALQTDDLMFTIKDFIDRANGVSPSGVAWPPRSKAASVSRTVHMFKSIAGPFEPA